jgi:5-methylcytosine-specific restriction endonuclease McrA
MQSAHRERGQWQCCQCKKLTTRKDLHGDHILPVIEPSVGFVDWNTYIDRLFLGQIQPICKECHAKKTKEENKVRKEVKQGKVWEDV